MSLAEWPVSPSASVPPPPPPTSSFGHQKVHRCRIIHQKGINQVCQEQLYNTFSHYNSSTWTNSVLQENLWTGQFVLYFLRCIQSWEQIQLRGKKRNLKLMNESKQLWKWSCACSMVQKIPWRKEKCGLLPTFMPVESQSLYPSTTFHWQKNDHSIPQVTRNPISQAERLVAVKGVVETYGAQKLIHLWIRRWSSIWVKKNTLQETENKG